MISEWCHGELRQGQESRLPTRLVLTLAARHNSNGDHWGCFLVVERALAIVLASHRCWNGESNTSRSVLVSRAVDRRREAAVTAGCYFVTLVQGGVH